MTQPDTWRADLAARERKDGRRGWIVIAVSTMPFVYVGIVLLATGAFDPLLRVISLVVVAIPMIVAVPFGIELVRASRRGQAIARDGTPGKGVITNVRLSGLRIQRQAWRRAQVRVTLAGREPFEARLRTFDLVIAGLDIRVLWHPDWPDTVILG